MKSYMSASGAVWAAACASALPFKRHAKTNGFSCHGSACGGIVGHWDVLFAAAGIHSKQNVVVAAAKVWLMRWRLGRRRARSAANNGTASARTFAAATATFVLSPI